MTKQLAKLPDLRNPNRYEEIINESKLHILRGTTRQCKISKESQIIILERINTIQIKFRIYNFSYFYHIQANNNSNTT